MRLRRGAQNGAPGAPGEPGLLPTLAVDDVIGAGNPGGPFTTIPPNGGSALVTSTCPGLDLLTGGGWITAIVPQGTPPVTGVEIVGSAPIPDTNTWRVAVRNNNTTDSWQIAAVAQCLNVS